MAGQPYQPQEQAESIERGRKTAQRGNLGVGLLIVGALLALLIPLIGPVIALIMGITMRKIPLAIVLVAFSSFLLAAELILIILAPTSTSP